MQLATDERMKEIFPTGKYVCAECGKPSDAGQIFGSVIGSGGLKYLCPEHKKAHDERIARERMERVSESTDDVPDGCEYTDEIVCPYCGYEFSDSWELSGSSDGDERDVDCHHCDKEFTMTTNVTVNYSTRRKAGGGAA